MCCGYITNKQALALNVFLLSIVLLGIGLVYGLWYIPQRDQLATVAQGDCIIASQSTQMIWYGQYQKCQGSITVVAVYKRVPFHNGVVEVVGYWDTCADAQSYLTTFYPVGNLLGWCYFKKDDGTILLNPPSVSGPLWFGGFLTLVGIFLLFGVFASIVLVVQKHGCCSCHCKRERQKTDETSPLNVN